MVFGKLYTLPFPLVPVPHKTWPEVKRVIYLGVFASGKKDLLVLKING